MLPEHCGGAPTPHLGSTCLSSASFSPWPPHLSPAPQSRCTGDSGVQVLRGPASFAIIYQSQMVLLVILWAPNWLFPLWFKTEISRRNRKKQLTFLNPKVTRKLGSDTFWVGFKLENRLTNGPWHHVHGEASSIAEPSMEKCLLRAELPRSSCKLRAGKTRPAQTSPYKHAARCYLFLGEGNVFSHIMKEYTLPFLLCTCYQASLQKTDVFSGNAES